MTGLRFPALGLPALLGLLAACGGGGGGAPPAAGPGADVVASVDPVPGARDVDPGVRVEIAFRAPMDAATLQGGALYITPEGANDPVGADVEVPPTGLSATIAPLQPLAAGRTYQVRLTSLARRAGGRVIGRPWYSEFRIGSGVPPPPPPPPQGGSVLLVGSLAVGRSGHAAAALPDGRVAVFGGFSTSSAVTDSIEVFDPATDLWTAADARLVVARARLTATVLADGRVLLAGGETASTTDVGTDAFEVWDPVQDRIQYAGTLAERRTRHGATALPGGQVLLCGGARTDSPGGPFYSRASAERFDPGTGVSSPAASMALPRAGHAATLLADGRVLVTGGHGTDPTAEAYDPASGSWTAAGDMGRARRDHTATLLQDGSVLVAGGGTFATERWMPGQDLFYPMQNMGDARSLHTAVRIASGRVFVAGGEKPAAGGGTLFHAGTEFFNPATGSFLFPDLKSSVPRSGHTATPLPGGDVLLAGGKNPVLGAPAVRTCDRFRFE